MNPASRRVWTRSPISSSEVAAAAAISCQTATGRVSGEELNESDFLYSSRPSTLSIGLSRPTRCWRTTAICAIETFERRLESTFSGRHRPRPWTPQLDGERPYSGRLEKDRIPRETRHPMPARTGLTARSGSAAAPSDQLPPTHPSVVRRAKAESGPGLESLSLIVPFGRGLNLSRNVRSGGRAQFLTTDCRT